MSTKRPGRAAGAYALSFLLPVCVMLAVYAVRGVYPFGGGTLLTIDMNNEYISYFSAYKNIFSGQGSFFYSFKMLLGCNFTGLYAVYLASPLNLLTLLFPRENLDVAVLVLTLLKLGLCGLTFAVFLRKVYRQKGLLPCVFSLFYALMAYNLVYQLNIMWLDAVILLPLVALGIELLTAGKRPVLYITALAAALLCNYYTGFMVCVFAALFFIYRLVLSPGFAAAAQKARFVRGMFGRFAAASLTAAGMCGFLLIPALLSLRTGKEGFDLSKTGPSLNFNPALLLQKLMTGAYGRADAVDGLPNIYCGVAVTLLVLLFFLNKRFSLREKLCSGALLLVLLLSFTVNTFNRVWHGFNGNTWFPYRYSFVFSFLLVLLAYRACLELRGAGVKRTVAAALALNAACVWCAASLGALRPVITALLAAAFTVVLVFCMRRRSQGSRLLAMLLLPLAVCDAALNSWLTLGVFSYGSKSEYSSYISQTAAAVDSVKSSDDGFYRLEKSFTRLNSGGDPTFNDSLMFGYNGLSHYSSADDKKVNDLMGCLGYRNDNNWVWYGRGSTQAADALLGVKYVLSKSGLTGGYVKTGESDGIGVYSNPYALPVAFAASAQIKSVARLADSPFTYLQSIYEALAPELTGSLFTQAAAPDVTLENLTAAALSEGYRYRKTDARKPAAIEYRLTAAEDGPYYAYIETGSLNDSCVSLTVNGSSAGDWLDTYRYGVFPLGNYKKGDSITLRLTLKNSYADIVSAQFVRMDTAYLQRAASQLAQGGLTVNNFDSTHVNGTVANPAQAQVLFTSIPFDAGWTVKIDGKKAETYRVLGTLLAVDLPSGTHSVRFSYTPPGLAAGCAVSAVSAAAALLWIWILLKRRKQNIRSDSTGL